MGGEASHRKSVLRWENPDPGGSQHAAWVGGQSDSVFGAVQRDAVSALWVDMEAAFQPWKALAEGVLMGASPTQWVRGRAWVH